MRNHLHLDTELNNYTTEAKIMVLDHPVEVIGEGLPLLTVKVTIIRLSVPPRPAINKVRNPSTTTYRTSAPQTLWILSCIMHVISAITMPKG